MSGRTMRAAWDLPWELKEAGCPPWNQQKGCSGLGSCPNPDRQLLHTCWRQTAATHTALFHPPWCCKVLPGTAVIFHLLDPCLHCRIFTRGRKGGNLWSELILEEQTTQNSQQLAEAQDSGAIKGPHFVSERASHVPGTTRGPQSIC